MNTKDNSIKIIDWGLSLKLVNNKSDLAKELLATLMSDLPQVRTNINQAYQNKDYSSLHQQVHKLHGATCYCGVPRLKDAASALEDKLKKGNDTELESLLKTLNHEIEQLIVAFNDKDF